jgi:hypothetical protein
MDVFPIAVMNTPIYAVHTSEERLSANPSCQWDLKFTIYSGTEIVALPLKFLIALPF